ncbi:hypothetical protein BGX29_004629 [Mortierella sp. GBA35]|nr:hypothetical protein BGX29_004629 [Mortierella sp. GBA35]
MYGYWSKKPVFGDSSVHQSSLEETALSHIESRKNQSDTGLVGRDKECLPEEYASDSSGQVDLTSILKRLEGQERVIQAQAETTERQDVQIREGRDKFEKLEGLLRGYTLDMDLAAEEEIRVEKSDKGPWWRRLSFRRGLCRVQTLGTLSLCLPPIPRSSSAHSQLEDDDGGA